ncbi:hypothetical protein CK203_052949 [Vitis vinifera]|uniref:Mitochondrial protein n=1 Tax=Vitis vinifera TaxID=29760 RepID=A0A438GT49_VITVI|nr:hypothetical protein CK203_052949 [Vitis vinifera]
MPTLTFRGRILVKPHFKKSFLYRSHHPRACLLLLFGDLFVLLYLSSPSSPLSSPLSRMPTEQLREEGTSNSYSFLVVDDLDLPIALRKGTCVVVPKLVQEALITPEWKNAVMEEIKALEKNGTWDLVKLLEGKSHVWCKWAFSVKHKPDGIVDLFKARLMAKRYT